MAEAKRKLLLWPMEGLQKVAVGLLLLGRVRPFPGRVVVLRMVGRKWASAHHVWWVGAGTLWHSTERLLSVVHEVARVMMMLWGVRCLGVRSRSRSWGWSTL